MAERDPIGRDLNHLSRGDGTPGAAGRGTRLTICLAFFFFLTFILGTLSLPAPASISGILITQYGLILLPTLVIASRLEGPVSKVLGLKFPTLRAGAGALLLGFPASLLASLLFLLQNRIFPVPPEVQDLFKDLFETVQRAPVLGLFAVAVSPGLCEELLFRGIILHLLIRLVGSKWSPIMVGLLFGLFHFEPLRFLVTASLGVVLGYITIRARSIIPAMILHSTYNLWLCLPALVGEEKTLAFLAVPWVLPAAMVLLVVGIALVVAGRKD